MRPASFAGGGAQLLCAFVAAAICGCDGPQSSLRRAGVESARVLDLFNIMLVGSGAIVLLVLVCTAVAMLGRPGNRWRRELGRETHIIAAGIGLPVVVLTALLVYGYRALGLSVQQPENALQIAVTGEQWWWRIRYRHADGSVTETANEMRIPVGQPVRLQLTSADVIHSFWVPSLAGKVDMIPGHVNQLVMTAAEPGIYRGQCAEYCGGPHALMGFYVLAETQADFAAWLERERSDASGVDQEGEALFTAAGCGGCHFVRGTAADGQIGPDLSHVGSRLSVGAGILRNSPQNLQRWIGQHHDIKPGNLMPPFQSLTPAQLARLAGYLSSLD